MIVQFGGQTPLKLAVPLERAGVPILGTSPDAIDRAEDRERFADLLRKLGLQQPPNGTARSADEAVRIAETLGYPVLVRPSYVLGGRAMEIVYDEARLREWMRESAHVSPDHPILIDKFLEDAIEIDVDALCDGQDVLIGGVMEHIEEAGIHSGDSACALPPYSLGDDQVERLRAQTRALALELGVVGLLNIQFAIKSDTIYVLEVNPRASRTVPFVSKAIGLPLAKLATRVMLGAPLAELGVPRGVGPAPRLGEGGGLPVREVPRGRRDPRARDAVHRRGDGDRAGVPHGVPEVAAGRRLDPAARGKGVPLGAEPGQAGDRQHRPRARRHGVPFGGHPGHREGARAARARRGAPSTRWPRAGGRTSSTS